MGNDAWSVRWTEGALEDFAAIIRYILVNEGSVTARELADIIRKDAGQRLKTLPMRGHVVPELLQVSREYKEIHIKGFRMVYLPLKAEKTVWIMLVARAQRSISSMLRKRLMPSVQNKSTPHN